MPFDSFERIPSKKKFIENFVYEVKIDKFFKVNIIQAIFKEKKPYFTIFCACFFTQY